MGLLLNFILIVIQMGEREREIFAEREGEFRENFYKIFHVSCWFQSFVFNGRLTIEPVQAIYTFGTKLLKYYSIGSHIKIDIFFSE